MRGSVNHRGVFVCLRQATCISVMHLEFGWERVSVSQRMFLDQVANESEGCEVQHPLFFSQPTHWEQ